MDLAGSIPAQWASFRMLTANLYTQLLIENVKMHPVILLGNRLARSKATVFEIVIVGSNPTSPASYVVLSVPVRTSLCESDRMGSTPIDQPNSYFLAY